MEEITSRANPLITHIRKLGKDRKYRRASGEFLCEGPKMLAEAARWGAAVRTVLFTRADVLPAGLPAEARLVKVPESLLNSVSLTETPQGVLFLCGMPSPAESGLRGCLVLDGVQDPGNVGTLWRTADAMDAGGLWLLPGCADPWNPKTLRATMGACFRFPVREGSLSELCDALARDDIPLYATALRDDTEDIRAVSLREAAVVIGSEGHGVSEETLRRCDKTLKIPMAARCESLNAAAAGTVALWEMCGKNL